MRIVVSFAVPSEFTTWRRLSGFTRVKGAGAPIYRTRDGQDELYAVITGIGTRHLQSELRQLFAKTVDVCIASGSSGRDGSSMWSESCGFLLYGKICRSFVVGETTSRRNRRCRRRGKLSHHE